MRCVILTQSFFPEIVASATLLTDLAAALARRGMEVTAVCGQPSYYGLGRVPSRMTHRGVTIIRPLCTWFRKDSLPGRFVNVATYLAGTLWHVLWRRDRGPLLIPTSAPLLGAVGYIAKRLFGANYVCLIYDVYPDVLTQCGLAAPDGLLARVWKRLNRRIFGSADRIVVIGRDMANVVAQMDIREDREDSDAGAPECIEVICNWASDDLIRPQDKERSSFFRATGIDAKFVLMYSGNFGRLHDISILIEAMERLRGTGVHLLLVGDGYRKPLAERLVAEKDLDNVSLYPYQPQESLGQSLTACDVQVALLDAPFTGLSVPSKLYGMLASGKPLLVVCEERSEMGRVVTEESCGVVVEPGDLEGVVEAIQYLREHAAERAAMGRRGRRAFEAKYALDHAVERYFRILAGLQAKAEPEPLTPRA